MAKKKEKKIRFNNVSVSGELVDIVNPRRLNQNTQNESIGATLKIRVSDGKDLLVEFFQNKFINGSPNNAYTRMINVINECATIAEDGEGDLVNVTGSVDKNTYLNKNNEIVDSIRLQGMFCNLEKDSKFPIKPGHSINLYALINGIEEEEDELKIKVLVNRYAYVNKSNEEKASSFETELLVRDVELIEGFKSFYQVGDVTLLSCEMVVEEERSGGFGSRAFVRRNEYLVITGGEPPIARVVDGELKVIDKKIVSQDDFPFTIERIELAKATEQEKLDKLESKKQENENEGIDAVENPENLDDKLPF